MKLNKKEKKTTKKEPEEEKNKEEENRTKKTKKKEKKMKEIWVEFPLQISDKRLKNSDYHQNSAKHLPK